MKTVHYQGQLVTFQLPDNWVEEHDSEGGSFYDPADLSVVLRLNVLTIRSPKDLSEEEDARHFATGGPSAGAPCELLPHDQALARPLAQVRDDQSGEDHHWTLARVIPPRTARLALFTTSVSFEQTTPAHSKATLEMILKSVRSAVIAGTPPEQMAAKPIWKRLLGL